MGWTKSYTIGRAIECNARLENDRVSRRHAQIVIDHQGAVYIADLGSRHGTFVYRDGRWRELDQDFVRPSEPLRFGGAQTTAAQLLQQIDRHRKDKTTAGGTLEERSEQKRVTVFVADVVGYSRMMTQDPDSTLSALKAARRDVIDPVVLDNGGRLFGEAGDAVCAEFAAAADAVRSASAIQAMLVDRELGRKGKRLTMRIGIHAGDVIVEQDRLFGSPVNIAARLQTLSTPGRICVSALVKRQAGRDVGVSYVDLGEKALKNIPYPIRVFEISPG